jgi:hypothetical protein
MALTLIVHLPSLVMTRKSRFSHFSKSMQKSSAQLDIGIVSRRKYGANLKIKAFSRKRFPSFDPLRTYCEEKVEVRTLSLLLAKFLPSPFGWSSVDDRLELLKYVKLQHRICQEKSKW